MLARYRGKTLCPKCRGTRLRPEASYVKVGNRTITELVQMPISDLAQWDVLSETASPLTEHEQKVAARILTEIRHRLQFLMVLKIVRVCFTVVLKRLKKPVGGISNIEENHI